MAIFAVGNKRFRCYGFDIKEQEEPCYFVPLAAQKNGRIKVVRVKMAALLDSREMAVRLSAPGFRYVCGLFRSGSRPNAMSMAVTTGRHTFGFAALIRGYSAPASVALRITGPIKLIK